VLIHGAPEHPIRGNPERIKRPLIPYGQFRGEFFDLTCMGIRVNSRETKAWCFYDVPGALLFATVIFSLAFSSIPARSARTAGQAGSDIRSSAIRDKPQSTGSRQLRHSPSTGTKKQELENRKKRDKELYKSWIARTRSGSTKT